jgi:hypothetical protein
MTEISVMEHADSVRRGFAHKPNISARFMCKWAFCTKTLPGLWLILAILGFSASNLASWCITRRGAFPIDLSAQPNLTIAANITGGARAGSPLSTPH